VPKTERITSGISPITGRFRYGKPIPLSEVKEQIRGIVLADKRKAAIEKYVGQARKKAKIRTYEKLLSKV
jgi:hypothetical protein